MPRLTTSPRKRRGAYVVEFALMASIFLLFLFGILEYARFVMILEMVKNAAREGARFAVVNTYSRTTSDVQNQVDSRLANLGVQLQNYDRTTSIQVYKADPVSGDPVDANGNPVSDWTLAPFNTARFAQPIAVQISGTYRPLLPTFLLMGSSIPIQTRYLMYSEAN